MVEDKKKVLIVEDEFISAEYLKELLLKEDYCVIGIVNNAEEAVLLAKIKQPDLILMDIMLDGPMSGCEAAVKIHQDNKAVKFICLTAYAEDEMIEYAIEADVSAYLLKPYRESEILATIKLIFAHEKHSIPKIDNKNENISLSYGYIFNIKKQRLFKENKEIILGTKPLKLLDILIKNRNVSVSNEQICLHIWGEEKNDRTLRSLIHRVRKVIHTDLIQNINGLGYKIT